MRSLVWLAIVLLANASAAESPRPAPPMAGAGILMNGDDRGCSAVLIAPDLVLSAGHCLLAQARNGGTGGGFRTGRYLDHRESHRTGEAVVVHPLYDRSLGGMGGLRADIGLMRLSEEIASDVARPIRPGPPPRVGEVLLVASWPRQQGEKAQERTCNVIRSGPEVSVMSCRVVTGESGGAVVRLGADGPELAAVMIATGNEGETPLAYALNVERRLAQLQALLPPPPP